MPTEEVRANELRETTRRGEVSRLLAICAVAVLILLAVPRMWPDDIFDASLALVFALLAVGTNVLFGWSGVATFGIALTFGIGAYTAALMGERGAPLGPAAIALVLGVAATMLTGIVILRAGGMAFAMFTLAVSQATFAVVLSSSRLGADAGLIGPDRGSVFGVDLLEDNMFWAFLVLCGLLLFLALRQVYRSSLGAAMRAVHDDPMRAAALGISVQRIRIIACGIAGGVSSIAGCFYAQLVGIAVPTDTLDWTVTGIVLLMIVLGGLRSFWGPAVGAVLYVAASKELLAHNVNPSLAMGLGLLLVFLVAPGGLAAVIKKLTARMTMRAAGRASSATES
jgi:branched-chain amino acid transport system permease protein